jgi:hypothetical protein
MKERNPLFFEEDLDAQLRIRQQHMSDVVKPVSGGYKCAAQKMQAGASRCTASPSISIRTEGRG